MYRGRCTTGNRIPTSSEDPISYANGIPRTPTFSCGLLHHRKSVGRTPSLVSIGGPTHKGNRGFTRRDSPHLIFERDGSMEAIMNFLGQTWVMVGMGLALVALIGVMIFLRMKPRDED